MLGRLLLIIIALAIQPVAAELQTANLEPVDKVLVLKSERELHLISNGERIRSFRVSLGQQPEGHKLSAGDNRTPEGHYILDWRNPGSDFYKSIHISYPNEQDRRLAESWGLDPGGNIMIHGLPNDADEWSFAFRGLDWTDGCISVSNEAMDEIWARVTTGTPIEIRP